MGVVLLIACVNLANMLLARSTGRQREGIGRDGRALFPLMPFYNYSHLSDEDLDAMFDHLRTVKPVRHRVNPKARPVLCPVCNHEHGMGEMNTAGR